MRVLLCHNFYATRAGECTCVEAQAHLLREAGHEVALFSYDNANVPGSHAGERLMAGINAIYSWRTLRDLGHLLSGRSFDVAHVHNTWPLMSPSVFVGLSRRGIPVVTTIHNFRWLCPAATLYRDGRVCHDCVEKPGRLLHAVAHRCYRDSVSASAAGALAVAFNRDVLRLFHRHVDAIVVQNAFVSRLLARHGFPAETMVVVANAMPPREVTFAGGRDAIVYAGRLEPAKGIRTLLAAAATSPFRLRIFGAGPLEDWVERTVRERFPADGHVFFGGHVDRETILEEISESAAVVLPSEWYESYPNVIVEAMAHGRPVIASRLGSIPEIVTDGENGLLFEAGNPVSLAEAAVRLLADEPLRRRLERGALATYEAEMTPAMQYARLLETYESAKARRAARGRR